MNEFRSATKRLPQIICKLPDTSAGGRATSLALFRSIAQEIAIQRQCAKVSERIRPFDFCPTDQG